MTKTVDVDGPMVHREDGTAVCIGYYTDGDGAVVARFASPSGEYIVPDAVESIEYVSSMSELPPVAEKYTGGER